MVAPPDVERAVRAFELDIRDELNVERLEPLANLDDHVTIAVELDIDDTSTLPPNSVPALRAALAAHPGRTVRNALLATGYMILPVGDVEIRLGWADLNFIVEGREGFTAAADRDVIVALDATMTPDLRRKALARHLVHQIQMMRKDARFNVADRIRISVDAHGEVAEAIDEHSPYICGETLAVELRRGAPPRDWMMREVDLEEARVHVAVTRA
jgi:isoleucyl-tRNA synthetase